MQAFPLKRKNIILRSFTFMLNTLKGYVICHQNKAAIHNKTTYKLSTATPVTSFIDTFFCSIIWTISPVGKHMTFYFQHKAKCTCCAFSLRIDILTPVCACGHILQVLLESVPSSHWEARYSQPWSQGPSACSELCTTLSLAFQWGKVSKTFLYHRGKKEDSLDVEPKDKRHTKRSLVPCIWNVTNNPSGD